MDNYERLKKQYNLPDFNKLDKDFEIGALEDSPHLMINIRKRLSEKFEFFAKLLEDQLQPEASLPVIHEYRFIDDRDKTTILDIYRRLMMLVRKAARLYIKNDEKKDAEYINESSAEWDRMEQVLSDILKKLEDSWSKELPEEKDLRYFG